MLKKRIWSSILVGCYVLPGLAIIFSGGGCATGRCRDAVSSAETHALSVESVLSATTLGSEIHVRYTVKDYAVADSAGLRRQAVFSLNPWRYEPTRISAVEDGSIREPIDPLRLVAVPHGRTAVGYRKEPRMRRSACPMCPGRKDAYHFHWPEHEAVFAVLDKSSGITNEAHSHWAEYEAVFVDIDKQAGTLPALYAVLSPSPSLAPYDSHADQEVLYVSGPAQGDRLQCRAFLLPREPAPLKGRAWAMCAMYPLAFVADVLYTTSDILASLERNA